jgi:hypothetical protein
MTKSVYIGSKNQQDIMVLVEGNGTTSIDVQRSAIQVARGLHRIMDPIPLSEHEAAVRLRRQIVRENVQMPNLNNGTPFWRQRDSVSCYCGK